MTNESTPITETSGISVSFTGSISEAYEQILGDFLFEPYAIDLIERLGKSQPAAILELACGTGRVTKKLIPLLSPSVHLTATDLETDMLHVAKQNIDNPYITWDKVDMTDIPYEANRFDLIVCQFGLMLVPDKQKALSEMYRVLKPGGKLIFSTWANLAENDVWRIGGEVLNTFIGINPITLDPGPFSMNDQQTLQWLKNAGFTDYKAATVKKTGEITTAAMAAKGFINGLPVSIAIKKKNPALLPLIEKELEIELTRQLGNNPLRSALNTFVFESIK